MRLTIAGLCCSLAFAFGCSADRSPTAVVVRPDSVAHYRVTFNSTWSDSSHPVAFPTSAHFSGLIGATHSIQVEFWNEGRLASPGIQAMAELGSKSPLDTEVTAAIVAGTARDTISGAGIARSPGQVSLDLQASIVHPLVTLVTMIAPSPDWFVGVSGLALLQNGQWVDSITVQLRGWDAGTDDGVTYIAMNAPATPHGPITRLEAGPFLVNDQVPALGTYTFVRRR